MNYIRALLLVDCTLGRGFHVGNFGSSVFFSQDTLFHKITQPLVLKLCFVLGGHAELLLGSFQIPRRANISSSMVKGSQCIPIRLP